MQLNVSSTTALSTDCRSAASTGASVSTRPKHGAHVRGNHRGPFGHSGDLNGAGTQLQRAAGQFMRGVGGHHPARGGDQRIFIRAKLTAALVDPGGDFLQRQELADDAGRKDQRLIALGIANRCRQSRHFLGIAQTPLTRAGVGISGIDGDGAKSFAGSAGSIVLHRRGEHEIFRVHTGGRRRPIGNDQRHILASRIPFDAACTPAN